MLEDVNQKKDNRKNCPATESLSRQLMPTFAGQGKLEGIAIGVRKLTHIFRASRELKFSEGMVSMIMTSGLKTLTDLDMIDVVQCLHRKGRAFPKRVSN